MNKKGFTLIELLIVVAIIAILASVVFVAIDPLRRFKDSRDSVRWQTATEVASAAKLNQLDNHGYYIAIISNMTTGSVYMITNGNYFGSCDNYNGHCATPVSNSSACIDLNSLVTAGYLGRVPISPAGQVVWDDSHTGYTLQRDSVGNLHVRACEAENSDEVEVVR